MMDELGRYAFYSAADSTFYDTPERLPDTAERFALADVPAPAGWLSAERGLWVGLTPAGVPLPAQGWKIHISATPDDAAMTLGRTWEYCVGHRVAFKFLRSRPLLHLTSAKYAARSSSGKLITVYPAGDALHRTLIDLTELLADRQGPYILSDLRWGKAPVFVRYGGFLPRYCPDGNGEDVLAIEDPSGALMPDHRAPYFRTPAWAPVPGFIAERIAERDLPPSGDFPYEIEDSLHFSNGGGVYVGHDRRTGARVLLKEARPHAGLDRDGVDAVGRLRREYETLRDLGHLGFVPAAYDYRVWWEHHFLVMEHIPGESLYREFLRRFPLVTTDSSPARRAAYTAWALDQADRIEEMLRALHEAGVVYADLHPHNIIVRPDGSLALVDFEIAFSVDEPGRPALGAPGFVAPPELTGPDVDWHAFGRVLLFLFVPLTVLLDTDPGKLRTLVSIAADSFPLPADFARRLATLLTTSGSPGPAPGEPAAAPDWPNLQASMVRAILDSATPERADRLYPGDPRQFADGGFGLAYGAAGVLHALSEAGAMIPAEHVEWLIRRVHSLDRPRIGLYDGLHGAAWVLDQLGRPDEALHILEHALERTEEVRSAHLFGGLAGLVLNLLHFSRQTDDIALQDAALAAAERLARYDDEIAGGPPGLMFGHTGVALAFTRLHEHTGDHGWLELAAATIRLDLAACERDDSGALQVNDGRRLLPYLANGSAGIALVLDQLLRYRADDELTAARAALLQACRVPLTVHAGLFTGRAGLIHAIRCTSPSEATSLGETSRRLLWHATSHRGHIGFPGDQLLRLSMDLATGSAGILLALPTGSRPPRPLPLLAAAARPDRRTDPASAALTTERR